MLTTITRRIRGLAVIGAALACLNPAWAADYPERPVTAMVPFPAGGSTDLMARAIAQLERQLDTCPRLALVDGTHAPPLSCPVQTVTRGDSKSLSIAAASIVAKVTRDRYMTELAACHPGYYWERNFGYGTQLHRQALARLGVTPHHRRSFKPIQKFLEESSKSKT